MNPMTTRLAARLAAGAALALVALWTVTPSASAHGDEETTVGYVLVEQALGHLAHDTSSSGIELAMEKVQDALDTKDQEGMSVAEVEQAMRALESGDASTARRLLQDSIKTALARQPRATGNETGTTKIVPELHGRTGFGGQDWLFLLVSIVAVVAGTWLAVVFRPHESVGVLRSLLGSPAVDDASDIGRDPKGS